MDWNTQQGLIDQIGWGYIPSTVRTKNNVFISLFIRTPTSSEQGKAAMAYSTEYQRALVLGLPNEDNVIQDMIIIGRWDTQTDIEIDGLRKDIHNIRRGLLDFLFNKTKLEQTRSLLRRAEQALVTRLNKRHVLTQTSAEAHATICQQRYLISCIVETEDGKSFWPTRDDFEQFEDISVITQLCELFFRQSRMSATLIRELARSSQWRMYWEIAKNTGELFGIHITSWSSNQRELAYWSTIYDSVYNAYERPSKEIINDDDLLDSWFIRQGEKIDSKAQSDAIPQHNKAGRNEEFIMADQDGARRVYQMNDPTTRARIKAKQQMIAKRGVVREQDMFDSQNEMRQQFMERQRKHIKDISHK